LKKILVKRKEKYMLKFNKNMMSICLIVIGMFLVIVSGGYCEATYHFNMIADEPIWGETGLILQTFESGVNYLSDGDIAIKMYPAGEWGTGEEAGLQSLQMGTLDLVVTMSANLGVYTDALYAFDIPFMFKNSIDAMNFAFKSTTEHTPLVRKMLDKASEDSGIMVLSMAPMGRRDIFANKPINSIADLKGIKIRTMASPIQVDAFNFMGAIATPLPYSECFTALQLKTVDAAENSPAAYTMMKFIEAAPYYFGSDHYSSVVGIAMSKKSWDSLPTAYQNIMRQAAVGAMNVSSIWALGSADYSLNGEVKDGAEAVVMISPEEKQELRKSVLPKLLDKYGEHIDPEILEALAQDDEVIAEWLSSK